MKKITFLSFFFSFMTLSSQAQIYNDISDNKKYFYDLGFNYSTLIFHGDASMIGLNGAYYFTPNLGIRTGLLYTRDLTDDCDWLIKVPALFSFRTETIESMTPNLDDCETFGEMLFSSLLYILPKRFELNAGPSFGYMDTYRKFTEEEKIKSDNYFINTKPMVTLDANAKMIILIGRVGLDFSMGVSYFLTRNIKYYSFDNLDNKISRWMGNLSVGAHYRF
ncbi:MAG: hypothetical protein ACK5KT_04190 [Dysgonomonas sp.]